MQLTTRQDNLGFSLIEFMIAMTISLVAIGMITSIYLSGLMIDGKNIKLARLRQEVSSLTLLMISDIKRAGYINDAHFNTIGTISGCASPAICSPIDFRTIITDAKDSDEPTDSCITYAYDEDSSGGINNSNAMGYRLHNGAIEVRVAQRTCNSGGWTDITDSQFVHISELKFLIQEPARSDVCRRTGTSLICRALIANSSYLSLILMFKATLIEEGCNVEQVPPDNDCTSIIVNENVRLKNVIYN